MARLHVTATACSGTHGSDGSGPVGEVRQALGVRAMEAAQASGDLTRPGMLPCVLGGRSTCHSEAVEGLYRSACPVLSPGEFDVETTATLGRQIDARIPCLSSAKGPVHVARSEADGDRHFVDTDALRPKGRAQITAFAADLSAQLTRMTQVSFRPGSILRATREHCGPHVQCTASSRLRTPVRWWGSLDGLLQRYQACCVGTGREERLRADVRGGRLDEGVLCPVRCPAHQVDEPRGEVVCPVLESDGICGPSGRGQHPRGVLVLSSGRCMDVPNRVRQQPGNDGGDPAVLGSETPAHRRSDPIGQFLRSTCRRPQGKVIPDDRFRQGGQRPMDTTLRADVIRA